VEEEGFEFDRGANIASLTRAVRARGEKRLVCAKSQFMSPTMRVGRLPSSARRHARTTAFTGSAAWALWRLVIQLAPRVPQRVQGR
jgi:hypothetical protein